MRIYRRHRAAKSASAIASVSALMVAMLVGSVCQASEQPVDQTTNVPDPYGLGERLAIIDWLHAHAVQVPEGATLDVLRDAYRHAAAPPNPSAATVDDQRAGLEHELWVRFGKSAPEHATVDEIKALLATLTAQRTEQDRQEQQRESQDAVRTPEDEQSAPTSTQSAGAPSVRPAQARATSPTRQAVPVERSEKQYPDAGYQFVNYSAPLTMYIKPHQEGSTLTVLLAIWNTDDKARIIDIQVSATSGRPIKDLSRTVPPHSSFENTYTFGDQVMGSRADACYLKVKEP
jgi:hypothetical protein